jgi:hypothetical protein
LGSFRRLAIGSAHVLHGHRGQPLLNEVNALRAWLRSRSADGSDFLFTSQKGGRLGRAQFFRIFQKIAGIAGLPANKRHPHVLKHSLASHLVAGNVNLALVRQALGHRSILGNLIGSLPIAETSLPPRKAENQHLLATDVGLAVPMKSIYRRLFGFEVPSADHRLDFSLEN